jgi:transposase-like protein
MNDHTQSNARVMDEAVSPELLGQLRPLLDAAPAQRAELVYNLLMRAERDLHLQQNPGDKANGFYDRQLGTAAGPLSLEVPRDRDGDFRPQTLPHKHARDSQDRFRLVEALTGAAYAPSAIRHVLHGLGLSYSEHDLDRIKQFYLQEFDAWMHRPLQADWIGLYIDAYHTDLKTQGRVQRLTVYNVLGLDWNAEKELLGSYHAHGPESKAFWLQVFNDLIERGIRRVLIVVSDNLSGLADAVTTLFPKARHQLCFVHLQRSVRRNLSRDDAKTFNDRLGQIKLEASLDAGLTGFRALLDAFRDPYPAFIRRLDADAERYLAFLTFPAATRKFFYTTNAVESFHASLERLRIRSGGFFQSETSLKVNTMLTYKNLRDTWRKGTPHVRANLYRLQQIFAQTYGELPTLAHDHVWHKIG